MELTINITFITVYVLSIFHLVYRIQKLALCGTARMRSQALNKSCIALIVFIAMSAIMIFRFSVWFGLPVIFIFVFPFLEYLNDEMQYKIRSLKRRRTQIDRTE